MEKCVPILIGFSPQLEKKIFWLLKISDFILYNIIKINRYIYIQRTLYLTVSLIFGTLLTKSKLLCLLKLKKKLYLFNSFN